MWVIAITGTGDPRFSIGANATLNSVAAGIEQLGTALANGNAGPLDWACASVSNATATARGMDAGIVAGTMLAKYAPAECR